MITVDKITDLLNDVAFLGNEADALKYVIDSIPYNKIVLSSGKSIIESLLFIDFAQQEYYRHVLEAALDGSRPVNLHSFAKPAEIFEPDTELISNAQKVLSKIAKHRAAIFNLLKNRPIMEWNRKIINGREEISLYDFVTSMVRTEKTVLKEMAGVIHNYHVQTET